MGSAAADQAIRVLLRKAAHVHYNGLSLEERNVVRKGFAGLDDSKDGRISLPEFLKMANNRRKDEALIRKLFRYLDSDRSGFMEFDEYVTLTYMVDGGLHLCCACSEPVVILGYTCRTCWALQHLDGQAHASPSSSSSAPASGDTFDLCLACFSSKSFAHPHDDFVDSSTMYHTLLSSTNDAILHQVQCGVCGDFHRMDMEGMIMHGTKHVRKSQKSLNMFVCEWCSSWPCNNCGKFFQGPLSSARRNKWLTKDLCCNACGVQGNMTDYEPLFEELAQSEVSHQCSTCDFKIKNGILWESYRV